MVLPELGKYHDEVAAWVGDALGQPVKIGALAAGWHGLGPSVDLRDVTVLDAAGRAGGVAVCIGAHRHQSVGIAAPLAIRAGAVDGARPAPGGGEARGRRYRRDGPG